MKSEVIFIEILPDYLQSKVKQIIVDDATAKKAIKARLKNMPGHRYGNPDNMIREEILDLMPKIYDVKIERHMVGESSWKTELLLITANKGVNLRDIIK